MSKVAIVGSGIAGLALARDLKRRGHHTTMFEKQTLPGMGAHAFRVELDGREVIGDLPSRMFNSALWPSVTRLYDDLNIGYEKVTGSQYFASAESDSASFKFSIPIDLKAKLTAFMGGNPRSHEVLSTLKQLQKYAVRDLANGTVDGTFAQYLKRYGFEKSFVHEFLYPALTATVCTCSDQALSDYPAAILIDALQKIGLGQGLMRVSNGVTAVVSALIEHVDDLRCDTSVIGITESENAVSVASVGNGMSRETRPSASEQFDYVILATPANHVQKLWPQMSSELRTAVDGFRYEDVSVVVHTDDNFMPPEQSNWSVFNFQSRENASMCTVWLNRFHTQWPEMAPVFQTIKPIRQPAAERVIRSVTLQRPVVTEESYPLWETIQRSNQSNTTVKLCGSYAMPGIPLLESAVASANQISQWIG